MKRVIFIAFLLSTISFAKEQGPLYQRSELCRSALFSIVGFLLQEGEDPPAVIEEVYFAGRQTTPTLQTYLKNAEGHCGSTGQPLVNMVTLAFLLMQP